jgi:3-isopropylmalate/(R)-2-methylmalate dehydratase large subunit
MASPKTLYDKLWDEHTIHVDADGTTLVYIDRQLLHEVTSPQAFEGLDLSHRPLWRQEANIAVVDHNVPTSDRAEGVKDPISKLQIDTLSQNVKRNHIVYFGMDDVRQGIVHVIGPEQGATLPGMTIVCGDSHTSTHGAMAALAFGIGTSEVEHVMATQTLNLKKSKNFLIQIDGKLPVGVFSKDVILYVIRQVSTAGGSGYTLEFAGSAISSMSMESRMTICNMAIEAGARSGLVAFDDTTAAYFKNRPFAPKGEDWNAALAYWKTLHSDQGAVFDQQIQIDVNQLSPQVSWGTSPDMVVGVDEVVPDPEQEKDHVRKESMERALAYMGLKAGLPVTEITLDRIFIGSCTNSRIEDLRVAAQVVQAAGKKVAASIKQAMVVPGSGLVKQQAEEEGLDVIFKNAGFEWREPGCSMCLAMNADRLEPYERCASTSNRNFEGRQGALGRTHLVSPAMAALAALEGHFADVRPLLK